MDVTSNTSQIHILNGLLIIQIFGRIYYLVGIVFGAPGKTILRDFCGHFFFNYSFKIVIMIVTS